MEYDLSEFTDAMKDMENPRSEHSGKLRNQLVLLVHVTLCYVTRIPFVVVLDAVFVVLLFSHLNKGYTSLHLGLCIMPSPSKRTGSASQGFSPSTISKSRRQQLLSVSTCRIKQLTLESTEHVSR